MISPFFSTTTVSPTRTSFSATHEALCMLARVTVVPASCTGGSNVRHRRQFAELADRELDAAELA